MKFTVVWSRYAEAELASRWMSSSNRGEVSRAALAIDRQLQRDPDTKGESRSHGLRILLVSPLGVTFSVSIEDRKVEVLDVWEIPDRGAAS
jgi:hypothetical protein